MEHALHPVLDEDNVIVSAKVRLTEEFIQAVLVSGIGTGLSLVLKLTPSKSKTLGGVGYA